MSLLDFGYVLFEAEDPCRYTWPYVHPPWSKDREPHPWNKRDTTTWKVWKGAADNAAKRYARQARKKYPEAYEGHEKGFDIPGAWIEDDC